MRILWVKAGGLLPPDMGGKIRSYNILKQLARRHQITLFTFYQEFSGDPHLGDPGFFDQIVAVPLPLPPRRSLGEYARAVRIIGAGRPVTIDKFLYPVVRERYTELLAAAAFDVVICDFLVPGSLMRWKTRPPTVLFTHNVETQVWERHYKVISNPLMKAVCWLEMRALAGAERRYVQAADHVLTVSENDRAFFLRYVPPQRVSVIPTGVDTEYFQPSAEPEQPDSIVFTGTMDWMPNEDGVAYFAEKILPLIRSEIPGAVFWVVGRRPPRRIQALASENIRITGTVDDIRPYLGRAALCVVPLRSGSGTRIKIFEAMAMSKAVVSTTLGAEGLPVSHGNNIVLADDPSGFARQVVRLLRDPPYRAELGQAARRLVTESYSWPAVVAHFEQILQQVADIF